MPILWLALVFCAWSKGASATPASYQAPKIQLQDSAQSTFKTLVKPSQPFSPSRTPVYQCSPAYAIGCAECNAAGKCLRCTLNPAYIYHAATMECRCPQGYFNPQLKATPLPKAFIKGKTLMPTVWYASSACIKCTSAYICNGGDQFSATEKPPPCPAGMQFNPATGCTPCPRGMTSRTGQNVCGEWLLVH
jgi:hypothetical protein